MSGAVANQRHVGFPTKVTTTTENNSSGAKRPGNCNPVQKPGRVSMEHVLIALRETKEEREVRIKSLFNFFDASGKGSLDFEQIEEGLAALNITANYKYARDLLKVCDVDRDGKIGYDEFRRYMDDKELELYAIFQAIDVEHHGCILPEELWLALVNAGAATLIPWKLVPSCFSPSGIEIDEEKLSRFVEHVDKDNNRIITFEEWRDFLLLYPHEATLQNIYEYWEKACLVDIGEQAVIPAGIRKHLNASKYLIAGGVAGAASRTATAPLDRLKVAMQVQTTRAQIVPAIKNIWQEGRFSGFFRGNGLNVMKVAPESAIRFYTYEMLKEFIVKFRGDNSSKSEVRPSERLVAGGLAGAVAQTAIYPADLIKTRLQTFVCESGKVPSIGALSRDIWKQEGLRAFYRGAVPSLLGIIPYAGIDLAAYETLKDMSRTYIHKDSEPGPLTQLGCGTVSGAFGATCVYPLQVIRTRLQAQKMNAEAAYRGMGDVFWKTLQHEGVRGFYKGIFPNLLKVIPSASITYLIYESTKKTLSLD